MKPADPAIKICVLQSLSIKTVHTCTNCILHLYNTLHQKLTIVSQASSEIQTNSNCNL